jgi:uncharacterized protein YrrD
MKLAQNARVETAGGQTVGHIDRVVLDPRTNEVTHLVVRKGLLFTEDKVVPIDLVARTAEERVVLRDDAGDLEQLPTFEETHYVPLSEYERSNVPPERVPAEGYLPPLYWYPPYPAVAWGPGGGMGGPAYVTRVEENIPEGTVALAEGAKVISADGQHVGNVEQVLTDPQADRATHFVVSQGLLFKTRKLVPTAWISDLARDEVRLAVGAQLLDELREYQPPTQ